MVTREARRAQADPNPKQRSIIVLLLSLLLGCLYPFTTRAESVQKSADQKSAAKASVENTAKLSREAAVRARLLGTYGRLPLRFEANQGQSDARVKFLARAHGYTLFLTANDAVLALHQTGGRKQDARTAALRYRLLDANPAPEISPVGLLPAKSNYLIGKDPSQWHTNIPNYARVRYQRIYPGVDLVYYGNERRLEFDFEVAPGADPRAIRLAVDGARQVRLEEQGDLVLDTPVGEARLLKPHAYQRAEGKIQTVASRYVLEGTNTVRFELGPYDRSRALVIDPVLEPPSGHPILGYSTYLGGNDTDDGFGIAVDSSGQAYVTGTTSSTNFPLTTFAGEALQAAANSENPDVFVAKLSADGTSLVYSTYLGGSSDDEGLGITVDTSGNAYVTGATLSPNFPLTPGAFQTTHSNYSDVFVTKLNSSGSALVYSTLLGGSHGYNGGNADQSGNAIAVDSSGAAYVTGSTDTPDFPTTPGAFRTSTGPGGSIFVTKLNPAGSALVYSTYLAWGGGDGDGIAVDSSGAAYVTGTTLSATDFPITPGAFQTVFRGSGSCTYGGETVPCPDAFVTKLNAAGSSLVYSTYLGGSGGDAGLGITVDDFSNVSVTGPTTSEDFPTLHAIQPTINKGAGCHPPSALAAISAAQSSECVSDAFVTKFNSSGSALIYSTYLGGTDDEVGLGITSDPSGNVYVTGATYSCDFPVAKATQEQGGNCGVGFFGGSQSSQDSPQRRLRAHRVEAGYGISSSAAADAFVTRIDDFGSSLVYSTYLGGANDDDGLSIRNDNVGNSYVIGSTYSTNFPTANPVQAANAGDSDAFVSKIEGTSAIRYLPEFSAYTFPANDDDSTSLVPLGFTVNFFGNQYDSIYINNNGNVTFDAPLGEYTPFDLTSTGTVIIAPFFGDVDTRAGSLVTFGPATIDGRRAFGVNWVNVGYYYYATDKLLSAQLILIEREDVQSATDGTSTGNFDIEFNYDKVQWETGDASGGTGGLGGDSARAGFSNGTRNPGTYFELAGSAINGAFLDNNTATGLIHNNMNSNHLGRYVFQVRGGVVQGADLAITKTVSSSAVSVGENLTYNITAINNGPADATAATVEDILPETLTLVSATASQGSCTGTTTITCNLGTLAKDASATVTIVATATATGQVTNTARVSSNLPDGNPDNNSASVVTAVQGADLAITKTASSSEVSVGGTLTYTLNVVNNGPAEATAVTVADTLPETLTLISVTPSQGGCTGTTTITCNLGVMANGAHATVTIVATATITGQVTNRAQVSANLPDGNPDNNSASITTRVSADLSLTPPSVEFEGNVDIICPAKHVTVKSIRQTPLTITGVTVSGPFSIDTNCRDATLAPGGTCLITVLFLPHSVGTFEGAVTIGISGNAAAVTLALSGHATPACRLHASSQVSTVVRGTSSTTFNIADSNPSCFTSKVNLSCADQSPATCSFSAATIRPTEGAVLTVGNLAAVTANDLNLRVVGTTSDHSASVNLAVHVSDFSLAASTSRATVTGGQSATYNLSLQSINGLRGRVNLSCTGAPMGATCSVTPASLTLDGAAATSFSVKVTTTARSLGAPGAKPQGLPPFFGPWIGLAGVWWLMALALLAGLAGSRRSGRQALLGLTAALLFVLLWAACAGGSNIFRQTLSTGTPAGTYSLTLSATYPAGQGGAASDLSHSTSLTLLVQ